MKALKKISKKRSGRKVAIRNILKNLPQSSVVDELIYGNIVASKRINLWM